MGKQSGFFAMESAPGEGAVRTAEIATKDLEYDVD